jgi:CDP-diacylglycerol pyrophosphatase
VLTANSVLDLSVALTTGFGNRLLKTELHIAFQCWRLYTKKLRELDTALYQRWQHLFMNGTFSSWQQAVVDLKQWRHIMQVAPADFSTPQTVDPKNIDCMTYLVSLLCDR